MGWVRSIAVGACLGTLQAQGAPEPRIPAAALQADVDLLQRAYGALHPGLGRYNTPVQLEAAYARLRGAFATDRTRGEAFLALAQFTAQVRCGHTYPNFFNQRKAVAESLFRGPKVPFHFRWLGNRMVVTRGFGPEALPPGTVVRSLNGVPTDRILATLLPLGRADGANDAKRRADLEVRGESRYEAFDIYFPLCFPFEGDTFQAVVKEPGKPARLLRLSGRLRETATPAARPTEIPWTLTHLDARTALLTMSTWALYGEGAPNWRAWLQTTVESLAERKVATLILDLRGNEGGVDVGDELLAHFLDAPLPLRTLERRTRYRAVPENLRPHLDTWDPQFFDWGEKAVPLGEGWFRLTAYDDDARGDVLQPKAPRLRCQLRVLVDAANSSATFQFAQVVQRFRLGTLIGEPTGGNQRGINGGAFFFLRLPGSGLEVDLPLIGRFPAQGPAEALPDAGLRPDHLVPLTARDLARGRDPQLHAARTLR